MKKKLSILLLICILNALNINAATYSGSCGTNVNYSLDTSTGLLSITGTGAMTNYSSYSSVPWYFNRSYIKTVEISNGVTSIGNNAFEDCSGLTSFTIPNSVTSIGDYAFQSCSGLTSVTIGNSVTSIGDYAFQSCSGLTSVTIGNSVTSIGEFAFNSCSGLTSVHITDIAAWCKIKFENRNSNPLLYAHHLFMDGKEITDLVIPNSVTSIKDYAFSGCSGLTSIEIPNSVTSIGEEAFYNCYGLTSVTIPNSVWRIGNGAFDGCYGLTSVTIPNSVWSIGNNAFHGCYFIKRYFINNSSIDAEARNYWGATFVDSRNNGFVIKNGTLLEYTGNVASVTIPNSVTSIGNNAFYNCSGLTSVTIPNSVRSIGEGAFYKCSSLASVTIGNSVTSIGNEAFRSCSGLTSVTIPNSVTSIGDYAFYNCSKLTSVTIPNSVTSIGYGAFYGCKSLTSVTIPNSVTSIGNNAFEDCSGLTSVTIGNSVTSIGDYAFQSCSGLTSVTIGNSVTSIGKYAFYDCSKLTSVTIPNSVTFIGSSAFQRCFGLTEVYCDAENVPMTNSSAFQNVNLTNATLIVPESSVAAYMAVEPWRNFGTVKAQGGSDEIYYGSCGNQVWYSLDTSTGVLKISGTGAMTDYSNTGDAPWYAQREKIKSVEIADGVTSIGNWVFSRCSGLTSITIPNSVTSIGFSAFDGCSGLISVTIPNSVTSIGNYAFSGCFGLTKVYCNAENVPNTNSSAFENVNLTNATLIVPGSSVAAYKATSPWSGFGTIAGIYSGSCGTNVRYSLDTSTGVLKITGTGAMTDYSNTGDAPWYAQREKIKSVEIADGVTSIGNWVFSRCSGLASIEIPNSVTSIGSGAFEFCSGLTSVTIPNSVTSIGNYAFSGCSGLTSVTIPNSVTSIGKGAFSDCSGLTEVYCNAENVPTTNSSAFQNVNLTNATLIVPESSVAAYMAVEPWRNFGTVKAQGGSDEIYYGSCGNQVWYSLDTSTGILKISGTGAMINYSSSSSVPWYNKRSYIKSVEISNGVTSIGNYAFYNCDSLTSVTIPSSVTSIGAQAFFGCSSLTSIEIPKSVITIGNAAFANCSGELIVNCKIPSASQSTSGTFYGSKFKSVTIGEGVTSIGSYAFYNCDSLTAVTIPSSVTSIEDYSFYGCENLTRVSINSNTIVGTDDFSLYGIFGSHVKEYILGNDVKSIGGGKFSGCTGLAYITIPNSVKTIGNSAFLNCSKLEYITIPNSVTSIGEYALSDCANLKSVTIGSGVQVIGKDVFENHHPSKVFWLTNTPPEGYAYAEGSINYVSNTRYTEFRNVIRYSSLSSIFEVDGIRYVPVNPSARTCDAIDCTYDEYIDSINIGEKVTYRGIALSVKQVSPYTCYENKYIKDINLSFKGDIGAKAFYGCSNMTTAELGNGILSIGESGFSSCSKLESIVIPDSVVAINDSTFCDCIVLNSAKIGRGVESIGRYAFSGCSVLPNIRIPQSVTSVAEYAFRGCENIKTVVMEDGNSELSLSSNDSIPLFADCPLDSVYIGRNILYETSAKCGYSPFYHNETLRTVVITDNETEISDNEFYSCTNLQSFKIGDGVTRFGNWAFSGCSSLKTLGFGTELQCIGKEAFSDCSAVTVIVSRTEIPPVCESQALEDINKWECTLYVPEGTSPDYQEADQWKDFWYMEEGAPYVVIRGDVNGDEFVNMKDAIFVTNIILGIEDATEAADVNNDGKINIQDVMFIVNYIKNGKFPDE